MQNIRRELEKEVESYLKRIEALALEVSAEHLFVAVAANLSIAPEDAISETTHGTVPVKLELLAYHIYPFLGKSTDSVVTPWHTQICTDALEKLFNQRRLSDIIDAHVRPTPIDMLMDTVRHEAEVVRGSAYAVQTLAEISSIQGTFEEWFEKKTGLGPLRACAIVGAIRQHHENAVADFIDEVQNHAVQYSDYWLAAKKKQARDRTEHERELLKTCRTREAAWAFGYTQRLNQVAPQMFPASHANVSQLLNPPPTDQEWNALIHLIGMIPNEREHMKEPIEVRNRPLYTLPGNRVLLVDVPTALDVLWERFEEIAKTDSAFFQKRYQRKKAQWLEDTVVQHLTKIFPQQHIYKKLSYPDPDKETDGATAELDAAVEWGPFLILVEAKAKQFRFEAQLGDVGRLRTDIKANVEDAFEQTRRAARYIERSSRPEFTEIGSRRKLTVRKKGLRRVYLLTVSQHHLANLATRLAAFQEFGLFQDGEYPLSISIADLETILEFCEGPDVFLHYIEKRLEVQSSNLEIMADELDYWGAYLDTRLASRLWKQEEQQPNAVYLHGWSERFDQWDRYKAGNLEAPPEIKLDVPPEIRRILVELRQRDDDGARWIAFALLDMSDNALATLNQSIQDLRQQSLTPGRFRRVTNQVDDIVISIVVSLDQPPPLLYERTMLRVEIEKYRRKAEKSIGFGIMILDRTKPFECATWLEGPWKYDPRIERHLQNEPPFVPVPGAKLPDRNDPCLCGSGRKFKHCCLPKIRENRLKLQS